MPSHTGLELNIRNILKVLHEAEFAHADWELLSQELMIKRHILSTIRASRFGQTSLCMMDTIVEWLRTDLKASWERLAGAVAKVEGYGEATAAIVQWKAGIGKEGLATSKLSRY